MRVIKSMGKKEFDFASKSIDQDYRNGAITREEARKELNTLKQRYKSGQVNRDIEKQYVSRSKNVIME